MNITFITYLKRRVVFFFLCFSPAILSYGQDVQNRDTTGVTYMTDQMASRWYYYDIYNIAKFEKLPNGYSMLYNPTRRRYKGMEATYYSYANVATKGKLPNWVDKVLAHGENPADFFRTAVSFGNDIQVAFPGIIQGYSVIDIGHHRNSAVIPDSYTDQYKAALKLAKMKTGKVSSDMSVQYVRADGHNTGWGDGFAWLMYPLYNGESQQNLDRFMQQNSESRKNSNLSARLASSWEKDNAWYIQTDASYNRHWDKWNRDISGHPSFSRLDRDEDTSDLLLASSMQYKFEGDIGYDYWDMQLSLDYSFRSSTSRLERNYQAQSPFGYSDRFTRNAHDIVYKFGMRHSGKYFRVANKHYLSGTVQTKATHHLLPEVHFELTDRQGFMVDLLNISYAHTFALSGNLNRSMSESPIIYRNQAAFSTIYKVADFASYVYDRDLFAHNGLKPEEYLQADLTFNYYYERLGIHIRGFYNSTRNLVVPVLDNMVDEFYLHNIGRSHQYGYQIQALFMSRGQWNRPNYDLQIQFHRSRNRAASLYVDDPYIKLAGFQEVATVFAKGETVGAIYGNREMEDGSTEFVKIGDPNPAFVMTVTPSFDYRRVNVMAVFEYNQGGDRWNGAVEESIQKATYFRMANVSVKYKIPVRHVRMSIGATVKNLFMLTSYKGVDPTTVLYGNTMTAGLDLFNQPATRQYNIHLTIELK